MKKSVLILLLFFMLSSLANTQTNIDYSNEPAGEFAERMQWFKDAKYGLFIHFGLYSQLGGVWQGDTIEAKLAEWIQAHADISSQVYAMLTHTFNPVDFDADFIVETAKKAGMKYLVITTKHHEGFCLWDSKYTNFDVMNTPFKRDILQELSDACRRHGIRFGTYYSIIDWHHPSQERNIDGSGANRWSQVRMKTGRKDEYVMYMKNQIRELIENYDTDILWFDGDWVHWWNMQTGIDMYNYIRQLKPEIIINNRVGKRDVFKKDFGTPENFHLDGPVEYEWEACYTMNNSWGFKWSDHDWKEPQEVYEKLKEINDMGGNFLLNIGPDGDGNVPEESVEILLKVGEMLEEE